MEVRRFESLSRGIKLNYIIIVLYNDIWYRFFLFNVEFLILWLPILCGNTPIILYRITAIDRPRYGTHSSICIPQNARHKRVCYLHI